jgi:protein-disulfide isomerase
MSCCQLGAWPPAVAEASEVDRGRPPAEREPRPSAASSEQKAKPSFDPRFCAGEPSSPIVLTLYACGRSERCAKLIPPLYQEVTSGRLVGKVRLNYRPFCTSADEGSAACCHALVAAARQGAFWPYLLHLYEHQEDFQSCLLKKWADIEGLDGDAFEAALHHPDTTALLAEARREALENEVEVIPSAFIGGHKIPCELTLPALADFLERAYAREVKPAATNPAGKQDHAR